MNIVEIAAGEAKLEGVARGLLDAAASLSLDVAVVVWSPSRGAFQVPQEVATAYAEGLGQARHEGTAPEKGEEDTNEPDTGTPAGTPETPPANLPPWQRYTDEQKATAVEAVKSGKTLTEVAAEIGAAPSTVGNWVKQAEGDNS